MAFLHFIQSKCATLVPEYLGVIFTYNPCEPHSGNLHLASLHDIAPELTLIFIRSYDFIFVDLDDPKVVGDCVDELSPFVWQGFSKEP
jgi:hypothetical protein